MINDLISYLINSDKKSVRLYFVIRDKTIRTSEMKYFLAKSIITPEIGEELIENGKSQLANLVQRGVQYIDYGILLSSDRDYIEKIAARDVPYLKDLITRTAEPDMEMIGDELFKKVWGYIIRIEDGTKSLFLFKKSNASKLLKEDKIAMRFREGYFNKLDEKNGYIRRGL